MIEHARYVLSQTPEMLPVLKQAGVVDSGGQGLVEVLSGAYDAFLGKEIDLTVAPQLLRRQRIPRVLWKYRQRQRSSSVIALNSSFC